MNELPSIKAGEDPNDYAHKFFQRILTGNHVLGMNYAYVTSCNYNRRSFTWCCMDAFNSFPSNTEVTVIDFYHLLRLVCIDFPKNLVEDSLRVVSMGLGSSFTQTPSPNTKYLLSKCQVAVYFNVVYGEWLILLEAFFQSEEGKQDCIPYTQESLTQLQQQINNWYTEIKHNLKQPSNLIINTIISNEIAIGTAGEFSSKKVYTLNQFRRALYANENVYLDLMRRPQF